MPNETDQSSTDFESAKHELSDTFNEGKQTATAALHDARDEVADKVTGYAAEAKEALKDQAEHTQQDISAAMQTFGGALRAAGEHLSNSDQRAASKMLDDAAGGIDRLATSLKNKPFNEILGDIRSFGKENATALVAASVLAGLAFGRFVKSEVPSSQPSAGISKGPSQMDRPPIRDGEIGRFDDPTDSTPLTSSESVEAADTLSDGNPRSGQ